MPESAWFAEGRNRLEQAALSGGGWGYHPGGQLFVEPTALALLALAPENPPTTPISIPVMSAGMSALVACQRAEGFFGTSPEDPEASWSTAPALLALAANGLPTNAASAGEFLARWQVPEEPPTETDRKEVKRLVRIDLTLRGWPSQAREGFATVEPTSLACIALRAWGGRPAAGRIEEGMRFLTDRACPAGGWNYGNPFFFDDALPPVTLPSAKGLLALLLCAGSRDRPLIARSTAALERLLEHNPSRKAHAWGALALAAAGDQAGAKEHARAAIDSGDGRGPWGGGPDMNALALLALRAAAGDAPKCLSVARA